MALLVQFLLRLTFGMAMGMALTSPQKVTSGYYRNHLYVALGLSSLAALLSQSYGTAAFWPATIAAVLCYVASVIWLYEKREAGRGLLLLVGAFAMSGAWMQLDDQWASQARSFDLFELALHLAAPLTSGLLLGGTMATMLLGHWYLNSPTMELAPLKRLIAAMTFVVVLHMIFSALGLWAELDASRDLTTQWLLFVVMRWTFGLVGVVVLFWMTWQTVKIPNTQSATGILYVAVIGTFVGETLSLLLSSESQFPL